MHSELKIFVIIVTYNGMQWLPRCLNELLSSTIKLHVIVVDNASTDDTVNFLVNKYPQVLVHKSNANLGFGMANNIGLRIALNKNADYIMLLNQDVYVRNTTLESLLNAMLKSTAYGILSPIQLNGSGENFDRNFGKCVKENTGLSNFESLTVEEGPVNIKFVMAAMWFMSRQCIMTVGGFDPIFSHYGEDDDYANRVIYHKFKIGIFIGESANHDREFRESSLKKKIHISYVQYLFTLKDININFLLALLKVIVKCFVKSALNLFVLNFEYSIKNLIAGFKAIMQFEKILKHRRLCKSPIGAFL